MNHHGNLYRRGREVFSLAAHPLRRSTDRRPAPTNTVSLVILTHDGGPDPAWLDELPGCVDEVLITDAPPPGRPYQWPEAVAGTRIVLIEADGSMSPQDIPHYLHYLDSGFDFVKGSRFVAGGGSPGYPLFRRVGHRVLLTLARFLYRQRITDLWFGFCAFRSDYLRLLGGHGEALELPGPETVIHALHYGLRIAEIPSREGPARSRKSAARTFHEGRRILHVLWQERPRNALSRFLLGPRRG